MTGRGKRDRTSQRQPDARDNAPGKGGDSLVSMPLSQGNADGDARGPVMDEVEQKALADIIEQQIIPRLVSMPRNGTLSESVPERVIVAMCDAAVANEQAVIEQQINATGMHGLALSDAMADIVTRSARRLGEDWEMDRRDFFDVTVGLGTLQRVVSRFTESPNIGLRMDRSALLGAMPGQTHTFGLAIVYHYFQQARWPVDFQPFSTPAELKASLASEWYTLVGISIADSDQIELAKDIIDTLRAASYNPEVKVMVGGPAIVKNQDLAAELGADSAAFDGREAVTWANHWADIMPRPRPQ